MTKSGLPIIIQGGMGVGVSAWQLAKAVSQTGQLGVVSGTALEVILIRRLQLGDPDGHVRRALAAFPLQEIVKPVLVRYFLQGGKQPHSPFRSMTLVTESPTQAQLALSVLGNFVEVFLAKENHAGIVGINYLEKIQFPTLPSLYGAMMAGVDYVLMGAGIPTAISEIINQLCEGKNTHLLLKVDGALSDDHFYTFFDPDKFTSGQLPKLKPPKFFPIIASVTLASMLKRKCRGPLDGFIVEGPTAGGHNAPPRGKTQLNSQGEPIYGKRDVVDLSAMKALGLPFFLAGSYGSPKQVVSALNSGATGVQVGTAFAFSQESGLEENIKQQVIQMCQAGRARVRTDPVASPTGFPFKVLSLPESLSEGPVYEKRQRICDLGYLRTAYKISDGKLGWRCPSEPHAAYLKKGGQNENTLGRKCVCNGLLANIGLGQIRKNGGKEKFLVTCGDDVVELAQFLKTSDSSSYSASDVVSYLLSLSAA